MCCFLVCSIRAVRYFVGHLKLRPKLTYKWNSLFYNAQMLSKHWEEMTNIEDGDQTTFYASVM